MIGGRKLSLKESNSITHEEPAVRPFKRNEI